MLVNYVSRSVKCEFERFRRIQIGVRRSGYKVKDTGTCLSVL